MNIKITYNWLLDYLETDADVFEIQKYLSLCGPSVERVDKNGDDYVMDIEITSNRIDCASVIGIAQEAAAILPRFGKKAKLKKNPLTQLKFPSGFKSPVNINQLSVNIPAELCPRFTAVVLDNIQLKDAPDFIKKRLQLCEIKSINNIVDISNYLMLVFGQPSHMFDYDKIGQGKMWMRESKKGEEIVTLDEKKITLPGGDMIIEDGDKKIVDLCGIMGGLNSAISNTTKRVVFFVQTYNKNKIRKSVMLTNQRTVASTFFEKGLDEERVEPTFVYGLELLEKYAGAKISSPLYDLNYKPETKRVIDLNIADVNRIIGVEIKDSEVKEILENLGFEIAENGFSVPPSRKNDVFIKEDLIEEIARIYGYHNLPSELPPMVYIKQPEEIEQIFSLQYKIKLLLKHLGLNEMMNYSMISKELITNFDLNLKKHLDVKNTISDDIKYLRLSLIPSLAKNIKDNEGKKSCLQIFEIAKVYPQRENELPDERLKLAVAVNTDFDDLKGIMQQIFHELCIVDYELKVNSSNRFFHSGIQTQVKIGQDIVGEVGKLKESYRQNLGLKSEVYLLEFDLQTVIKYQQNLLPYRPVNPFAVIKLDLTLNADKIVFGELKKTAFAKSQLLQKIEVLGKYQNKLSLRFYFSSSEKNITQKEAEAELENLKKI